MKPILFSTPMVQAILAGRKTQTRRVMKPQMNLTTSQMQLYLDTIENCITKPIKPKYQVGDILWVRETWKPDCNNFNGYCYRADLGTETYPNNLTHWEPSIFMPKKAARIFLRVTDVRVERLQDITGKDAESEGAFEIHNQLIREDIKTYDSIGKAAFKELWDSINGKKLGYTWCDNPFCWVYSFERCDKEQENE